MVSCAAVLDCMASTFGGTLATTDGGSTWTQQTLPSTFDSLAYGIACPTSSECTAVGSSYVGNYSIGEIAGTTDGGTSWSAQTLPSGLSPFGAVSCASTSHCIAGGSDATGAAAYSTSDGGATWSQQTLPAGLVGFLSISCPSATTCEAVGQDTSNGWMMARTTDGGGSWSLQALPSGDRVDALSCPTSSDCFVGGDGAGGGVILATTDGGTTWAAQTAPAGISGITGISCATTSACTAVGYDFAGASETAVVLATTDGGSTWSLQTLPSGIGALESVSCATSAICEAVGYQSTGPDAIVGTTDGGTTWTSQTAPYGFGGLLSVSCPSSTACEAVGGGYGAGGQAVATSDGGTTWTAQVVPSAVSALDAVSCASASTCVGGGTGTGTVGGLLLAYATPSAPTVATVTPNSGPATGGTSVTIDGTGFTTATGVSFGAAPASSFHVVSDTELTAVSPAGSGTVDVTVTSAGGTSATSSADQFTYTASAPSAPTNLSATLTDTGATISWAAPNDGGSPITSYSISGEDTTTSTSLTPVTVTGSPPATSGSFTGLTPGDSYTFSVTATNAVGTGPPSATLTEVLPAPFVPVAPTRICDTRTGTNTPCSGQTLSAGSVLSVQVTGGVVPTGATAVVANVTVTGGTAQSYLTAYPEGSSRPLASNLNFTSGQTVANLVTVPLSATGGIDLYNAAGSVNVLVDVTGYYGPGTGQGFVPLSPARICDTRSGTGTECSGQTLGTGSVLRVQVTGQGGVPAGATAVVANLTVTKTSAPSYLTAYADGTTRPLASNLNWKAGETVPNRVELPLSAGGALDVYNAAGAADVLIDVVGYYSSSATGYYEALPPDRICDTRTGTGTECSGQSLSTGSTLPVQVTGEGGVQTGAAALVANVTVTRTDAQSYLTVYPGDASRPLASDLNWTSGVTVPNLVIAKLSATGGIDAYNAAGAADVLVDVAGWFTP